MCSFITIGIMERDKREWRELEVALRVVNTPKQVVILNENSHQLYTVYQTQARFLLLIAPSPSHTI